MDEKTGNWLKSLYADAERVYGQMPVKGKLFESLRVYEWAGRYKDAAELCLVGGVDECGLSYLRKAEMYSEGAEIAGALGLGSAEHFRNAAALKPDEAKVYMDGIYVQPMTAAQWMTSG